MNISTAGRVKLLSAGLCFPGNKAFLTWITSKYRIYLIFFLKNLNFTHFFPFIQKRPLKQLTFADLVGQVLAGIRQMRFRTSAATGAFQRRRSNYGTSSEIWGFNSLWKIDPRPKNISKINLLALIAVIGLCSGEFCVLTSMYRLFLYMEMIKEMIMAGITKMILAGITTRGGSWPRLTGNVWSTR